VFSQSVWLYVADGSANFGRMTVLFMPLFD